MKLAQSTHSESLVRRRPVERAAAARGRSRHQRPGAGFLPLRLPVARSARPGYRIYSVDDFLCGFDAEPTSWPPCIETRRRWPHGGGSITRAATVLALLLAGAAAVLGVALTTAWSRAGRTAARTNSRGVRPRGAHPARRPASLRPGAGAAATRTSTKSALAPGNVRTDSLGRHRRRRAPRRVLAGPARLRVVRVPVAAPAAPRPPARVQRSAGRIEFGFEA